MENILALGFGMGLLMSCLGAFAQTSVTDDSARRVRLNLVDGLVPLGDSGVSYVPYETMEKSLADLVSKHPNEAKLVQYGKSVNGRNLNMVRIELPGKQGFSSQALRPAIEISGAIHGNEFLGIEDKLLTAFLEKRETLPGLSLFLAAGGVVYFIPVVNPDGYSGRKRANAHAADLNRDFDVLPIELKKLNEPETAALAKYLDSDLVANQLSLRFVMDYHCCVPALIMPWTYKNAYPKQPDLAAFNSIAAMEKATIGFPAGNAQDTVHYLAVGSTLDYYYAKYGTLGFTIEGKDGGELPRLDQHLKFLDQVFQKLANQALFGDRD